MLFTEIWNREVRNRFYKDMKWLYQNSSNRSWGPVWIAVASFDGDECLPKCVLELMNKWHTLAICLVTIIDWDINKNLCSTYYYKSCYHMCLRTCLLLFTCNRSLHIHQVCICYYFKMNMMLYESICKICLR